MRLMFFGAIKYFLIASLVLEAAALQTSWTDFGIISCTKKGVGGSIWTLCPSG
jgi:hypothetical protein